MLLITLLSCVVIGTCAPLDFDDDQARLSVSIGIFAQRLYAQLPYDVAPFVLVLFSTYVIHLTLSMAFLGALGDTAQEMKSVLLISNVSEPHGSHNRLLKKLRSQNRTYTMNSQWFDSDKDIKSSYKIRAGNKYGEDPAYRPHPQAEDISHGEVKQIFKRDGDADSFQGQREVFTGISDNDVKLHEVVKRTNIEIREERHQQPVVLTSSLFQSSSKRIDSFYSGLGMTKMFLVAGIINDPSATEIGIS